MTVSYTGDVANASGFGPFAKVLLKWKGSVYKLIFKELFVYIAMYFFLNAFYRTILSEDGWEEYRYTFESLKAYCKIEISSIPLTFILGFYVNMIVTRWWEQYILLPWPDSIAIFLVGLMKGTDDRGRLMRRNFIRYILLSYVITLRKISFRVRKRFPTFDHLIELGLLRPDELKIMDTLNEKAAVKKWWMPLVWATHIVEKARSENRINNDPGVQTILNEISTIRKALTKLQHYDTISVPLVYTQVATLAVYFYFLAGLMGAQWVSPSSGANYAKIYELPVFNKTNSMGENVSTNSTDYEDLSYHNLDLYYPLFLTLQFAFYVGWLKVAETLINPFGEDDDDFDLNYLIDRHIQVGFMIVDDMYTTHTPELAKDIHWADTVPTVLPYTEETVHYRKEEPMGGAEKHADPETNDETYVSLIYKYPMFHMNTSNQNGVGTVSNGKAAAPGIAKDNVYQGSMTPEAANRFNEMLMNERNYNQRRCSIEDPPQSDYEAIDTSLFGWWKAKLRKSQIRKSLRSTASYRHAVSRRSSTRWPPVSISRIPTRKSTKSLKSQMSNYSKMLHRGSQPTHLPGYHHQARKRSISVSALPSKSDKSYIINELNQSSNLSMSVPDIGGTNSGKTKEPVVLMVEPYSQSSGDETVPSKKFEDRLDDFEFDEEKDELVTEGSIPPHLAHIHSYLSTIDEANSPYGTEYGGSKKSNHYPPTAASLFSMFPQNGQHPPINEINTSPSIISRYSNLTSPHSNHSAFIPTSESESPYYPLSSETSNRPTTPRFTIEEVASANYEPILITSSKERTSPTPTISVTSSVSTDITSLTQASPHTSVLSGETQTKETSRTDKQLTDSPVLPRRQARMALNAITNMRKEGALPNIPAYQPKLKEEEETSTTNPKKMLPTNVQHLASQCAQSPKLPPPNKRKTSILKDGMGSKSGDKKVNINEVTNKEHHYDPLEKVRADKKKLEEALMSTKIGNIKNKAEGNALKDHKNKDTPTPINIKVTPPTRQNTLACISLPPNGNSTITNNDEQKKNDSSDPEYIINVIKNTGDILGTCELQDVDAYGDILQDDTAANDIEIVPTFTIFKEDSKNDDQKTPEESIKVELESECTVVNFHEEEKQNCDNIGYAKEAEDITNSKQKDETDLTVEIKDSKDNLNTNQDETDSNDNELLNPSPSILNIDNANSAFEISTFYV